MNPSQPKTVAQNNHGRFLESINQQSINHNQGPTMPQLLYRGRYARAMDAPVIVPIVGGIPTVIDPPLGTEAIYFVSDVDLSIEVGYGDNIPQPPKATSMLVLAGGDPTKSIISLEPDQQAHIKINGKPSATTATFWIFIQ